MPPLSSMIARRAFARPTSALRVPAGRRFAYSEAAQKTDEKKLEQAPKRDPELYVYDILLPL